MTTSRRLRTAFLALASTIVLAAPAVATAQGPGVARLVEVKGSVLLSRASTIVSARDAQRLLPGTRVITTAAARAVVEYDNGCRISLAGVERFELPAHAPCGTANGALPSRRIAGLLPR